VRAGVALAGRGRWPCWTFVRVRLLGLTTGDEARAGRARCWTFVRVWLLGLDICPPAIGPADICPAPFSGSDICPRPFFAWTFVRNASPSGHLSPGCPRKGETHKKLVHKGLHTGQSAIALRNCFGGKSLRNLIGQAGSWPARRAEGAPERHECRLPAELISRSRGVGGFGSRVTVSPLDGAAVTA
jgi:hypothetical protein